MTAKEYLGQAYRLDQRINSKLEQIRSLNELAAKCTSTITGMPKAPSHSTSMMEEAVGKIVDLQTEIDGDIGQLVDLKRDMVSIIKAVQNTEYQTLLELRYLCFKTWDQIGDLMNYSTKYIFELHERALKKIKVPKKDLTKTD